MRTLVLGAGAVGGYFGGRLAEAGADVTFFVREARARLLAKQGLRIESPLGDTRLAANAVFEPKALTPFDLVILTCKSYDLDESLEAIAGAVGPGTGVLPLLNGFGHLDRIASRFAQAKVFGGVAQISATLEDSVVRHFGERNRLIFGARDGRPDDRLADLEAVYARTPVSARFVGDIEKQMWDKFVLLAALAGITSLMRASIGNILATPSGEGLIRRLLAECESVARAQGWTPSPDLPELLSILFVRGSSLKASMLRDIERGGRTEGEHILGDMLERAQRARLETPVLEIAATHLRAYEASRSCTG